MNLILLIVKFTNRSITLFIIVGIRLEMTYFWMVMRTPPLQESLVTIILSH